MSENRIPIRRALVSVYDKTGLEELVRGLHDAGVTLVSTGGSAKLIEGLGLKGSRIGGAEVSTLHANFIVNTGAATAANIDQLIQRIQQQVEAAHAVRLHPEVKRLGFTEAA